MHAIIYSSSQESPCGGSAAFGTLEARGGAKLDRLTAGDIVWVVQRMPGARRTPGLCGRVVVESIASGGVGGEAGGVNSGGLAESSGTRARRIVAREGDSRHCEPFACPVVHTWGVWRQHYRGVMLLTDEQAGTMEQVWSERPGA
ncbi:MAG TPA: hypothetical protein VD997_09000 [Phycisphaerales bacterium]|nr:hypothetical protein [Phycisphaerales bacterium]